MQKKMVASELLSPHFTARKRLPLLSLSFSLSFSSFFIFLPISHEKNGERKKIECETMNSKEDGDENDPHPFLSILYSSSSPPHPLLSIH